jgi:hypothetical protein
MVAPLTAAPMQIKMRLLFTTLAASPQLLFCSVSDSFSTTGNAIQARRTAEPLTFGCFNRPPERFRDMCHLHLFIDHFALRLRCTPKAIGTDERRAGADVSKAWRLARIRGCIFEPIRFYTTQVANWRLDPRGPPWLNNNRGCPWLPRRSIRRAGPVLGGGNYPMYWNSPHTPAGGSHRDVRAPICLREWLSANSLS